MKIRTITFCRRREHLEHPTIIQREMTMTAKLDDGEDWEAACHELMARVEATLNANEDYVAAQQKLASDRQVAAERAEQMQRAADARQRRSTTGFQHDPDDEIPF